MGLFSKKQSDEEYARLKTMAINDYNRLLVWNPFASAEVLRDKWNNMFQQMKQVYKLSKKYIDTQDDVILIKNYMETATANSNEYNHEVEYLQYKEEFDGIYNRYKELEEDESNMMDSFGDAFQCFQIFEELYNRVVVVYKNYNKFSNDNLDPLYLDEMYNGIAYYYCGFMLNNLYYEFSDGRVLNWDYKKECIEKCEKIAKGFAEERFKVLVGIAEYEMGELWKESAQNAPRDRANELYNRALNCRKSSVYSLNIIENRSYCMKCSVFNPMEWHYLKMAFWDLYTVYIYTNKDHGKAYSLVNMMIETQDLNANFSDAAGRFISQLKDELGHFKQGLFGGWKYNE